MSIILNNICIICGHKTDRIYDESYDPGCKDCAPLIYELANHGRHDGRKFEDGFPKGGNFWQGAIAKLKQIRCKYTEQKCSVCLSPAPHKLLVNGICDICNCIQSL